MSKKIVLRARLLVALMVLGLIFGAVDASSQDFGDKMSSITLTVYGNANGDLVIDEQDIDYINGIIAGNKEKTILADANLDGVISEDDIKQIQAIMDHTATKLHYVDIDGQDSSVTLPVESIVVSYTKYAEIVRVLGAADKIIGIDDAIAKYPTFFPELCNLPSFGDRFKPDAEKILALKPDVFYTGTRNSYDPELENKLAGIDVVRLPSWESGKTISGILVLSYILGKEDKAYEYLKWHDDILHDIQTRVGAIPEDEKVTVLLDSVGNKARGVGSGDLENSEIAGAVNIGRELDEGIYPVYDTEWAIQKDPDHIISIITAGYNANITPLKERLDLVKDTFRVTSSAKNDNIHVLAFDITNGASYLVSIAYEAKWFYPELFEDLNPQKIHQDYIDRFCGISLDVSNYGFAL
ncbi:ABC transporter substrate-binding protein [Methanospirillum sp. J.3.6.1-F.2.7.3]|jgi:iron complex transport system substrate-binding protein|uniref:ABC transporter substrate-binding protein n=2 Tax=Methanospirillum TaxID=2202 RepID=A0A8E7EJV7_9EURY|nr:MULTISPECIES: ABC transporter substrate-binding protein [Methanospirillum]MDX8549191.1 ABC transporter substrate-binding protein [Methanospirillum hungatei]QVV88860.1 ABC transporter substrate-binding protein [Methanospirillum sp. J.3.6.1-F.2.7.3]QXO93797.1 ABC transporter substrate-binding protein [Methanospirillum hungatei]